jgi:hypothetical protein
MRRTGVFSSDLRRRYISPFLGCQVRYVVGSERMMTDFGGYKKGDLGNSEKKNDLDIVSDLSGPSKISSYGHNASQDHSKYQ